MNRRINSTDTLVDVPFNIQTLLLLQEQAELLENIAYKLGDNTVVSGFKKNVDGSRDAGIVVYKNKIIPANKVIAGDDDLFEFINAEEEKVTAKDGSDVVFYKKYYLKQKAGGTIKGVDFENITTLKSVKGPKYLGTFTLHLYGYQPTTAVKIKDTGNKVTVKNGDIVDFGDITVKYTGTASIKGYEFGVGRKYRFDVTQEYDSLSPIPKPLIVQQSDSITRVESELNGTLPDKLSITITKLY